MVLICSGYAAPARLVSGNASWFKTSSTHHRLPPEMVGSELITNAASCYQRTQTWSRAKGRTMLQGDEGKYLENRPTTREKHEKSQHLSARWTVQALPNNQDAVWHQAWIETWAITRVTLTDSRLPNQSAENPLAPLTEIAIIRLNCRQPKRQYLQEWMYLSILHHKTPYSLTLVVVMCTWYTRLCMFKCLQVSMTCYRIRML